MGKEQHSELIIEMTPFVEEICGKGISVSVLDTAQKYYCELVAENADEPKAMYPHTRNRIYPGVAVFRALTNIGIERSRAAEMFRKFYRQRAEKPAKKIRSLLKIPGLYKLMPKIFRFVMQKNFGEDAVVIANALHIMPESDRAMSEICRVLKEGGTLIAPTFIHEEGSRYRFRIKMMNLIGFKTYSKWNADEFAEYIKSYGYEIQEQSVLGSTLTPLCCLVATRTKGK